MPRIVLGTLEMLPASFQPEVLVQASRLEYRGVLSRTVVYVWRSEASFQKLVLYFILFYFTLWNQGIKLRDLRLAANSFTQAGISASRSILSIVEREGE